MLLVLCNYVHTTRATSIVGSFVVFHLADFVTACLSCALASQLPETLCGLIAFCEDDEIVRVTRVSAHLEAFRSVKRKPGRRLQSTTSEGGQAHEVREKRGYHLLGCRTNARTTAALRNVG